MFTSGNTQKKEAVALGLASGRSIKAIAKAIGVNVRTVRRGRDEDQDFRDRVLEI